MRTYEVNGSVGPDRWAGRHGPATVASSNSGRAAGRRAQGFSWCLIAVLVWLAASPVLACSVPVFRYALERWEADPYTLVVWMTGGDAMAEGLVSRTEAALAAGTVPANLVLRRQTLTDEPAKAQAAEPSQSVFELHYPVTTGITRPLSRGPLDEAALERLARSPLRTEVGRRLLGGDCAVWVLLESGDTVADAEAAALLESRLEALEEELEIQTLDPADVAAGLVSVPESALEVRFSMVRLSRQDPAESVLIALLLGSEHDLAELDEPMAFPIFGRGRVLYALVGRGISARNIDRAAAFLVGPCSCEAKELNPGIDLLMAVDWDGGIERSVIASRALPPLAGVASFETETDAGRFPPEEESTKAPPAGPIGSSLYESDPGGEDLRSAPAAANSSTSVLPADQAIPVPGVAAPEGSLPWTWAWLVGGGVLGGVGVGTWWLCRRGGS